MIKILRPWPAYLLLIGIAGWISIGAQPPTPQPLATNNVIKPAAAPVVTRLAAKDEATFAGFLRDNGYVCDRVVSSRRLISEPGVSLYCESWVYDFHQKAGRWTITARKGWGQ